MNAGQYLEQNNLKTAPFPHLLRNLIVKVSGKSTTE